MKFFKYLSYVLRHKWYVMLECFKIGLYWQGITHDLSKFLPREWFPYMNHFYGGGNTIDRGRTATGYYKPTDTGDPAFDMGWLSHTKLNKHHWQYWCTPEDGGGLKVYEMPLEYLREMLCDWKGAGRAQGKPDTLAWYKENRDKMSVGPGARNWLDMMTGYVLDKEKEGGIK